MLRRDVRAHDERGQVFVIVAFSFVVFLLIAALVIDVGNWYSHKRQLQNRADAGALAAGSEYEFAWIGCAQGGAAAAASAAAIETAARKYSGDLNADPNAVNTETANNANVSVFINSTSYDSQISDGGGPCVNHSADDVSRLGGYWTDVKVRERDLASFFGSLGIPLNRNIARARVELRPAISDHKFVPIAIPDFVIQRAQVRFHDECARGATIGSPIDLSPLKTSFQTVSGTTLWGKSQIGQQTVDPSTVTIPIPLGSGCSGDYVPVSVEIRVSGRTDIDLNAAGVCDLSYVDCWTNLAQVRGWKSGDPNTGPPLIKDVRLQGGACAPDPYFSRSPSCTFGATVDVDWGDRDNAGADTNPLDFSVWVNGKALSPPTTTPGTDAATGLWTYTGAAPPSTSASGGTNVSVAYDWTDRDTSHSWRGDRCTDQSNTPCQVQGNGPVTVNAHRAFVGTDANAGIVQLIKLTTNQYPTASPNDFASGQADGIPANHVAYLTVGLNSSLLAGQFRTLRASDGSGTNQSLDCDPNTGGQGHDFQMFLYGCQPYYSPNTFTPGYWWTPAATPPCPSTNSLRNQPNSPSQGWQCVPTGPGLSGAVIAGGIAGRTGNCADLDLYTDRNKNSCVRTQCLNLNKYQQYKLAGRIDPNDKRIVKVFVVPYGSLKGLRGGTDAAPVLTFSNFYVTGWKGNGSNDDPCPTTGPYAEELGNNPQNGEIYGHFINYSAPSGPTDPNSTCDPLSIRPCRAVLVR